MTSEATWERSRRALRDRVAALVAARFRGDWAVAFGHYAVDGGLTKPNLEALLADVGVRDAWDRWAWASVVLAEQDADADGRISWAEFCDAFQADEPTRSRSTSPERGRLLGTSSRRSDGDWPRPTRESSSFQPVGRYAATVARTSGAEAVNEFDTGPDIQGPSYFRGVIS
jgi:hypothetical protein